MDRRWEVNKVVKQSLQSGFFSCCLCLSVNVGLSHCLPIFSPPFFFPHQYSFSVLVLGTRYTAYTRLCTASYPARSFWCFLKHGMLSSSIIFRLPRRICFWYTLPFGHLIRYRWHTASTRFFNGFTQHTERWRRVLWGECRRVLCGEWHAVEKSGMRRKVACIVWHA
jgi:hypothetical protein